MGKWRKSSYSTAQGGACIEVADSTQNVMIRDTKQERMTSARTVLTVTPDAWRTFTAALR